MAVLDKKEMAQAMLGKMSKIAMVTEPCPGVSDDAILPPVREDDALIPG